MADFGCCLQFEHASGRRQPRSGGVRGEFGRMVAASERCLTFTGRQCCTAPFLHGLLNYHHHPFHARSPFAPRLLSDTPAQRVPPLLAAAPDAGPTYNSHAR